MNLIFHELPSEIREVLVYTVDVHKMANTHKHLTTGNFLFGQKGQIEAKLM